jgi:hypothetical protein
VSGPAICVLDKVGELDYDGHAALKYSAAMEALTEAQKGKVRHLVRTDLADVFSDVQPLDVAYKDGTEGPTEGEPVH